LKYSEVIRDNFLKGLLGYPVEGRGSSRQEKERKETIKKYGAMS
jgi:hypothetical protein